jgi:hypothetical protein
MILLLVGRLSVGKNGQTACGDGQTGHFERELCKGEGVKKVTRPRRTTKTGRAGGRVLFFVKEPPK